MAPPSRMYVGITVFGLIASLVTVPYTLLVLSGYEPPAASGVPVPEGARDPAQLVFLALASLFSVGLTVFSWRSLVHGARRDAQRLRARQQARKDLEQYARERRGPRGPT